MARTSIVPDEAQQFRQLRRSDWWDPNGASAMLHKLNPVRLKYIRDQIDQHWQVDECSRTPLEGKTALDVGCGAGLLAEPLARLGRQGHRPRRLARADRRRSRRMRRRWVWRSTIALRELPEIECQFDLITCMEVIEHVVDPRCFVSALAKRLAPAGLLILSTPNATAWSRLLMITVARGPGAYPARYA